MVTGGAGFIGSHVIRRLLNENYRVVCVDNFDQAYSINFKHQNISPFNNFSYFSLKKVDICNFKKIKDIFQSENIESVIHLAAKTGVRNSLIDPLAYEKINIGGTYTMLYLAYMYKVKRFVFASSSSIYGNGKVPFRENQIVNDPLSPYACSKRSAELACFTFHKAYGLPVTILRLFSVYGPSGRPDMAPYRFTEAIFQGKQIVQFGDKSIARDWTYIDDAADGIFRALTHPTSFTILNLGSGKPITTSELIKHIENLCRKKAGIKHSPRRREESLITYANNTKAYRDLGWKPKVPIKEGLTNFVEWYKENRLHDKKI